MTCDNWINLIAAILVGGGTLALAFMTWKSIRQTRTIHEAERKDRLLSEIIEWTTDILQCSVTITEEDMKNIFSSQIPMTIYDDVLIPLRLSEKLEDIAGTGVSIYRTAKHAFPGSNLEMFVELTYKDLVSFIRFLKIKREGKIKKPQAVRKLRSRLDQNAIMVIREATKIKTRDIS